MRKAHPQITPMNNLKLVGSSAEFSATGTDILDYISVGKEASMSYDSIVTEILSMSAEKRWNLLMEIASSLQPATNCSAQNKKRAKRKLGGFEEGFFMADDFDKTPECFKEYL